MNTRDRILARLRAAPRPPLPEPDIAGFYAASPPAGLPQQLAQWARSMKSYQGQVVWCHAHDWEDALLQQLRSRQVRRLLLARQTAHGARTLAALARLENPPQVLGFDLPLERWKAELFRTVDASLTLARAGIADTGSLVLWPDADEPRSMSLVPPVHFVLWDTQELYPTLYDIITGQDWADGLPTNALLVSEPSKTADIQQTLAYGAHGPRELVILAMLPDDLTVAAMEALA